MAGPLGCQRHASGRTGGSPQWRSRAIVAGPSELLASIPAGDIGTSLDIPGPSVGWETPSSSGPRISGPRRWPWRHSGRVAPLGEDQRLDRAAIDDAETRSPALPVPEPSLYYSSRYPLGAPMRRDRPAVRGPFRRRPGRCRRSGRRSRTRSVRTRPRRSKSRGRRSRHRRRPGGRRRCRRSPSGLLGCTAVGNAGDAADEIVDDRHRNWLLIPIVVLS